MWLSSQPPRRASQPAETGIKSPARRHPAISDGRSSKPPASAPPASSASSLTPSSDRPNMAAPIRAARQVRKARRPRPHIACSTTAITTGFTPYRSQPTAGTAENSTYAQARATTIAAAGMMNPAPASNRPSRPARSNPKWIAISVELGPGIRFVTPRRSRNRCSESQRRRSTNSCRISATCAAGPPNGDRPESQEDERDGPRTLGAAGCTGFGLAWAGDERRGH